MSLIKEKREEADREVLKRCLRGETESFGEIVEAYKHSIFERVYRWVGHAETAEEITQDVFMKAFRQAGNFRGEAKFSTWLYQIALNRCRDFYRSGKSRKEQPLPPDTALESPAPLEDEKAGRAEDAARLRRALEKLPPIYREAVSLRYLDEMSNEEITKVTGESLSNVKMRVSRGLMKLREHLGKEESP